MDENKILVFSFPTILLDWLYPVIKISSAVIGFVSIVALYGFFLEPEYQALALTGVRISAALFSAGILIRVYFAESRWIFLFKNYFRTLFLLNFIGYMLSLWVLTEDHSALFFGIPPALIADKFFISLQIFVFVSFFHSIVSVNTTVLNKRLNPNMLLMFSFFMLILLGSMLLMLPRATTSTEGLDFVQALFMAASAVCVTGLSVLDLSADLSRMGQVFMLILIQLGGIGIMTLTTLLSLLVSGGTGLRERANLKELLGGENFSTVYGMLVKITLFTTTIEGVGFLLVYPNFPDFGSSSEKIFQTLFHVISAFCNAGFTLSPHNMTDTIFADNRPVIIVTMVLVVIGGIGFNVLSEVSDKLIFRWKPHRSLSVHSKVVLGTTLILILGGALTFFVLERPHSIADKSLTDQLIHAFFMSITPRTAGFNIVDMHLLSQATIIFTMGLMYVGASPNSTGGGVKTTTLAVSMLNIYRIITGQNKVRIFKSSLSGRQIDKAYALFTVSGTYVMVFTLLLQLVEIQSDLPTLSILYEVLSALNTVGLSLGITGQLSNASLLLLTLAMFIGRIGFLTIPAAMIPVRNQPRFEYAEKSIII